ncbi:MAG: DeoR/GlpR family DNA-binding transcription regulator, partial [Lachnospiraceae bacterium]|nr:DeoR/GlpR family DNA-binding transcription regulator [Lachnospiraceae bacterium]
IKILEMLQNKGEVEVSELATLFETSEMTIRRDLNELVKKYNITRTHGGAMMPQHGTPIIKPETFEPEKISNKEKKDVIARKAASFIDARQRIFVDAGSTTRRLVSYLDNEHKNIIVTNSITVIDACMKYENLSVIMLGGEIQRISRCSMGDLAEEQLRNYQLDVAFLGAAAVGADGNVYDGYSPEARFKKTVFEVAQKVYLMVDSTKFNTYDLTAFASLEQFAGVITDSGIDEETIKFLRGNNVEVIIAQ